MQEHLSDAGKSFLQQSQQHMNRHYINVKINERQINKTVFILFFGTLILSLQVRKAAHSGRSNKLGRVRYAHLLKGTT